MADIFSNILVWLSGVISIVLGYFLLPYIWDLLKQYQRFFLWSIFFVLVFAWVSDYLAFVIYTFSVGVSVALSPFVTPGTVTIILAGTLAVLVLAVGKIVYGLVANKS